MIPKDKRVGSSQLPIYHSGLGVIRGKRIMDETNRGFVYQAATCGIVAPLFGIFVGLLTRIDNLLPASVLTIGIVCVLLYVFGFIFSVITLCFVRKYGTKGLLVRGILGVVINGLIIGAILLSVPVLKKSRRRAQEYAELMKSDPYTFTPPLGFTEYPEGKTMINDCNEAYIKPDWTDGTSMIILVEDLGGTIAKESIPPIKRKNVKIRKETWKSHEIDVFEIRDTSEPGVATITFNAQIPVVPQAIQLKVVGVASKRDQILAVLREGIKGVEGTSNW